MDKATRRLVDAAIAAMTGDVDGRVYIDELGPAVYRIEPAGSECVVLGCARCKLVTIRPGSPRLERFVMHCQECQAGYELQPPAEVVAFGRSGLQVVATGPRPH